MHCCQKINSLLEVRFVLPQGIYNSKLMVEHHFAAFQGDDQVALSVRDGLEPVYISAEVR